MSMGRQEAFEIFKRDYQGNSDIEEQKKYLKKNYSEAKLLGEIINAIRSKLSTFLRHQLYSYKPGDFLLQSCLSDNLKTKSEEIYMKMESYPNDSRYNSEYEALRKTMEFEKEK